MTHTIKSSLTEYESKWNKTIKHTTMKNCEEKTGASLFSTNIPYLKQ